MANCAGVNVIETTKYGCVVTDIDSGDWTMVRGLIFPEDARSVTVSIKGKGTMKIFSGRMKGTPLAVVDFDNATMSDVTVDLSKTIPSGKTYSNIFFAFYDVDESSAVQFNNYRFNTQTAEEVTTAINNVELDSSDAKHSNATYNISGLKVGANAKGIVIRNGRKQIVK